jgi:hypothetical protein
VAATATAAGQTIARTTIAEIKDADFPSNAGKTITGRFVHMNGYAFIMCTDGAIYHSDLNSLSGWTSTAYLFAQASPDGGVGVMPYRGNIAAFGVNSIEFFTIAGNAAGSVLSPIGAGSSISGGAANQYSICSFANSIAFAGNVDGQYGVFLLDGMNPKQIASTAITEFVAFTGNLLVNAISLNGQANLVVSNYVVSTDNHLDSFMYTPSVDLWQVIDWSGEQPIRQSDITQKPNSSIAFYVGPSSRFVYYDGGSDFAAITIQTDHLNFGTSKRKTIDCIRLIGSADANVSVSIAWYDDNYVTLSTARTLTIGSGKNVAKIHRCGSSFIKRAFVITVASPTLSFEMSELDIDYVTHTL